VGALRPSADSALILAVELPPELEAIRLRHVPDAARQGLPAHATLLYPFAEPGSIDAIVLAAIASIARRHPAWTMTLGGLGRWPDAVYATVEPDGPVRALQAELAAAFPTLPLYGDPSLRFEPHVTVAEGDDVRDPEVPAAGAWAELPVTREVRDVALVIRTTGRWTVARRFPLGAKRR
jgi:2'-5' RNA ligase